MNKNTYILAIAIISIFTVSPVSAEIVMGSCEMQIDIAGEAAFQANESAVVRNQRDIESRFLAEENFLIDEQGLDKTLLELQDQMVEISEPEESGMATYAILRDPRYYPAVNTIMDNALSSWVLSSQTELRSDRTPQKVIQLEAMEIERVHGMPSRMVSQGRVVRTTFPQDVEIAETIGLFELVVDKVGSERSTLLFKVTHVRAELQLQMAMSPAVMKQLKFALPQQARMDLYLNHEND